MNGLQLLIVLSWSAYALSGFLMGWKNRRNPFGLSKWFLPIGSFVWTDAIVFGLFFFLVSIFSIITNQFILFLLIVSIFWTVRSIGEQVYWFLEQFAPKHRNAPHTLWPVRWFKGEESWIVMQVTWLCISVVFVVLSAYLLNIWFKLIP